MASIDILDNACLRKIFLLLGPGDKLTVEKVCERWRNVVKIAWNNIKSLDMCSSKVRTTDYDNLPDVYQNNQCVAAILRKSRRYLEDLTIGNPCHFSMLPFIAANCRNIVRLEITVYQDRRKCGPLPRMEKLQYLRMDKMNESGFAVLAALPYETLKELHLQGTEEDYDDDVYRGPPSLDYWVTQFPEVARLQNLVGMSLEFFNLTAPVGAIINGNRNLKSLSLVDCRIEGLVFDALTELNHLDLENTACIDDAFLKQLLGTCKKLKYLNINQCFRITDEALEHLAELPGLEDLNLNYVWSITDVVISRLYTLKRLSTVGCSLIRDGGVINLVKHAPKLEYVNLKWTKTTAEVFRVANRVTKMRTNGISLRIKVSCDDPNDEAHNYTFDSPLLIVECRGRNDSLDASRRSSRWPDNLYSADYVFSFEYESETEEEEGVQDSIDWDSLLSESGSAVRECNTDDSGLDRTGNLSGSNP